LVTPLHEGVALDDREGVPRAEGSELCRARIDIQEDPAKVEAWAKGKGITLPVLLDQGGAYRVTATPTTVLIDRAGRMLARGAGMRQWDGDRGRALLDAALAAP